MLADLYPILHALYPVLALVAANLGEIPMSAAGRSLAAAGIGAIVLQAVLWLLMRSRAKSALLATGLIVLFASYGHAYHQVEGLSVGGMLIGRHRYLLAVWTLAAVGWALWVCCQRAVPRSLRLGFQAAGIVLVALPILAIGRYWLATIRAVGKAEERGQEVATVVSGQEDYPDIFYIILDGYARSDVLRDLYGVDNSEFIELLESRGFYVAERSASNYSQTLLSLASSLNMQYLDELAAREGRDSGNLAPLDEMIAHSKVRRILGHLGYQFVAFETGYGHIDIRDADLFLAPRYDTYEEHSSLASALRFNEFEGLLLDTTMVKAISEYWDRAQGMVRALNDFTYYKHRARIVFTLESLGDIAAMPGHYFVYAHVISPHPPFVFGRYGQEIPQTQPYGLDDGSFAGRGEYLVRYADQTVYVTRLAEQAVEEILVNSEVPPIIIIQGDHGPGAYIRRESPFESDMRERLSILNAYLVPDEARALLYPTITPVNTFRVILGACFGLDLGLLPDESYFSPPGDPYWHMRVTDTVR